MFLDLTSTATTFLQVNIDTADDLPLTCGPQKAWTSVLERTREKKTKNKNS